MTNKICAIFPGQGSQSVGMLAELAEHHPIIQQTFEEASDLLGYDIWLLAQEDPESKINLTEYTQPVMLVANIACWRLFQSLSEKSPSVLAGHSLGEWAALVAADAISFERALELVRLRAEFMQSAVPAELSGMAAILGLDDAAVIALCDKASDAEVVEAVNFNSPGQVVVAGHKSAVDTLIDLADEAGAKRAMPLSVSVPSHSSLLESAAQKLSQQIANNDFSTPAISVIHNVDGKPRQQPADIKKAVSSQIHSPVLWVDCVQHACELGVDTFIEIGPGKVLAGLCKRINRKLNIGTFESPANVEKSITLVEGAAA